MKLYDYIGWISSVDRLADTETLKTPIILDDEKEERIRPEQQIRPALPRTMSKETQYQRSVPYLLLPPNQEEMYSYSKRYLWWIILPTIASLVGLCTSQIQFASTAPWLWWFFPFTGFTFLYYTLSLSISIFTPDFDLKQHKTFIEDWKKDRTHDGLWPSVDILLPICGESTLVLKNTWKLVMEMCKIYPGKCTVYILDDGNSPEAKAVAQGFRVFGFHYAVRPNRGVMKKAGNLKFGFEHSEGDAILIFDADFCPHRTMLFHLLPYLWADAQVGIVQSPQFFRTTINQNWLARGAGAVQEFFYRFNQVGRNHHKGAICVGTCALYRRKALESIGGPYQITHSEDVWTGVACYDKGWTVQYIPVNLASGLCPSDYMSFVRQQYRWCLGSMSLLFSEEFWSITMPLMTRLCYISGFCYYAYTAIFIFIMPVIPIILVTFLYQRAVWEGCLFLIPTFLYSFIIFPLWHKCDYRLDSGLLNAMATKLLYSWAHAFTLFDLLRGKPLGWQPTGSSATHSQARTHWHVRHVRLLAFSWGFSTGIAWIGGCLWRMSQSSAPWNFSLVFLMGILNLLIVLRASIGASK